MSLARIAASWRTDALLCAMLTLDATCPDCSRQGGVPHLLQVGQVQHRLHPAGRLRHACHLQKAGPQERPLDPVPWCLVSPGVGAWCHPERVTPTAALVWQEEPSLPVTLLIRPGVCYPWSVACRWVGGVVMNCGAHQVSSTWLGLTAGAQQEALQATPSLAPSLQANCLAFLWSACSQPLCCCWWWFSRKQLGRCAAACDVRAVKTKAAAVLAEAHTAGLQPW